MFHWSLTDRTCGAQPIRRTASFVLAICPSNYRYLLLTYAVDNRETGFSGTTAGYYALRSKDVNVKTLRRHLERLPMTIRGLRRPSLVKQGFRTKRLTHSILPKPRASEAPRLHGPLRQ